MSFFFQQPFDRFTPFTSQSSVLQMNPFLSAMFGGASPSPSQFFPFGFAPQPPQQQHHHQRSCRQQPPQAEQILNPLFAALCGRQPFPSAAVPVASTEPTPSPTKGELIVEHRLEQGPGGFFIIRPYSRKLTPEEQQSRLDAAEKQRRRDEVLAKRQEEQRREYLRQVEAYTRQQEQYAKQRAEQQKEQEECAKQVLAHVFGQLFGLSLDDNASANDTKKQSDNGNVTSTTKPAVEEPASGDDDGESIWEILEKTLEDIYTEFAIAESLNDASEEEQQQQVEKVEEKKQESVSESVVAAVNPVQEVVKVSKTIEAVEIVGAVSSGETQPQQETIAEEIVTPIITTPVDVQELTVVQPPAPVEQQILEPTTEQTADDLNDDMLTKLLAQTETLYTKRSALLLKIKQSQGNSTKITALQNSLKQLDKLIEQTHQYTQELLDE